MCKIKLFFAVVTFNSFVSNALFLYPLKTSENRKETVGKNGLNVCEKRLFSDRVESFYSTIHIY